MNIVVDVEAWLSNKIIPPEMEEIINFLVAEIERLRLELIRLKGY